MRRLLTRRMEKRSKILRSKYNSGDPIRRIIPYDILDKDDILMLNCIPLEIQRFDARHVPLNIKRKPKILFF